MTLPFALTAFPNASHIPPSVRAWTAMPAASAVPPAGANGHPHNPRQYRYARHPGTRAGNGPADALPRARRSSEAARGAPESGQRIGDVFLATPAWGARSRRAAAEPPGEAKSPNKSPQQIFADFAEKIGMSTPALRRDPGQGLARLFRCFGPAVLRTDPMPTLSVHAIQIGRHGFSAWCDVFGIAAAIDETKHREALPRLLVAVQDFAVDLLQSRHGGRKPFQAMCRGIFVSGLRQGMELGALRAALAARLRRAGPDDALGEAEAYWLAKLILCKYEPSLGRMDAPETLAFGSPQQLHRHLAIVARTAGHASHWTLSERRLLQDPPPPNVSRETLALAALKFAYARHRDYLPSLPDRRPAAGIDAAIIDHAIDDLRNGLHGAGIGDRLLSPGADGLDALPADWIERIDWIAFDGPDFLLRHGAAGPYRNTLQWWMSAMRDGFQLEATFDVGEMNSRKRRLFVGRVADSQAFGDNADIDWDLDFSQRLFNAFLRHYIAPLAAASFERALWRATEPLRLLQCADPALSPGLPRVLRSVAEVKEDLRRELFKDRDDAARGSKAEQQWTVRFLCSIYAPPLAMAGVPGRMGYGGADYSAAELAGLYPGLPRGNLSMAAARQLLEPLSLMQIMRPVAAKKSNRESDPASDPAPEAGGLPAVVKRMAHAHGAIDAAREPLTLSDWEKALRHFEKLAPPPSGRGDAVAHGMRTLIDRAQSIQNVLLERGADPMQRFALPSTPSPYLNLWVRTPLAFGQSHTLQKIVMEEALPQFLAYGDLDDSQRILLQGIRDDWPKSALLHRCRKDFDKAFDAMVRSKVTPALRRLVQSLPADEQRFWQCGRWTIRQPRATLAVGKPHSMIPDARARPTENVIAGGAVLVDLTLENETRHYWASLRPLGLARYAGSEADLIRAHLPVFFPADAKASPHRKITAFVAIRNFYAIRASGAQDVLSALVAQAFPEKKIEDLYRTAIGETDTERAEADIRDFILSMLPGYGCTMALTTPGRLQGASFACTLDAAGALPFLKIGARALAKMAGIARRAIHAEVLAARLGAASFRRAAGAIAVNGYPVLARSAKEVICYLDPGLNSAVLLWRIGKAGLTLIKNSIRHIAELDGWRTRIDKIIRLRDEVFPERGLWRAMPEKLQIDADGSAYLRIDGARYEVADLDDIADVLVISDGAGRVRPVNPETGLACGFARRRAGVVRRHAPPGRLEKPAATLGQCRIKRAPPVSVTVCAMAPAPHIGHDYYAMPDSGDRPLYQEASGGRAALLEIDASSIAYRSCTVAGGDLSESDIFFHGGVLYRRLNNGHLMEIDWGLAMDDVVFGSFSHEKFISRSGAAGGKAWYVRTKVNIDRTKQGDGKIGMICMAPYGDFKDAEGTPLRMVKLFNEFYVFRKSEPLRRNHKFKLRKATLEQIAMHATYGKINSFDYPEKIKNSILRLFDEPRYRSAIDTTLQRFDEMLDNAKRYYSSTDSNKFLRKFVHGEDIDLAEQFRRRLLGQLGQIEAAMPHLKAHKDEFIAVADLKASGESLAMSLNHAMAYPLDARLLNKPVLLIDQTELAVRPSNVVAAYLGHELMHTVLGALDSMRPGSEVPFYAKLKRNGDVDISMLRFGAQTPGLDPTICASVLEHCLSVGDGMARGDVRVRDVVHGESSVYNRGGDDGAVRKRRDRQIAPAPSWSEGQIADVDVMSYILISAFPFGQDEPDAAEKKK